VPQPEQLPDVRRLGPPVELGLGLLPPLLTKTAEALVRFHWVPVVF